MRPVYLFMLLAYSFTAPLKAQNFYLKAGFGNAFPMPGQTRDQLGNVLNGTVGSTASTTEYNVKTASFSAGIHAMVGAGYMITKNIGIELNADMLLASRKYYERHLDYTNSSPSSYNYTSDRKTKKMIMILPSLLLQTANKGCNLYMRMGLALPFNTGIKQHELYSYQTGRTSELYWDIKNYFSPGFTGATGVKIGLGRSVALWGEVSMLYMALLRKERKMTSAFIDGMPYLPSQLTGVTEIHYSKNGVSNGTGNAVAFSQPYSNIAVNIGLSFDLHSKPKKEGINSSQYIQK